MSIKSFTPLDVPETVFHYNGFEQVFVRNGLPFLPHIVPFSDPLSLSANVIMISLEAGFSASLDWSEAKQFASLAVEAGKLILWEFKLGLFSRLFAPLTDENQCLTFKFALEHFRKTLWPPFSSSTFGAVLYRGPADFSSFFSWTADEMDHYQEWLQNEKDSPFLRRLFCQEFCKEYFHMLAPALPEEILQFIFLDAHELSMGDFFCLTSRELYTHFHIGIRSQWPARLTCRMPVVLETEEGFNAIPSDKISLGVCLPSMSLRKEKLWREVEETIRQLSKPFLVMSDLHLPQEWEGIEILIIFSEGVTSQGLRKLRGFCAAGGHVATVGDPLGLENEMKIGALRL